MYINSVDCFALLAMAALATVTVIERGNDEAIQKKAKQCFFVWNIAKSTKPNGMRPSPNAEISMPIHGILTSSIPDGKLSLRMIINALCH